MNRRAAAFLLTAGALIGADDGAFPGLRPLDEPDPKPRELSPGDLAAIERARARRERVKARRLAEKAKGGIG